MGISVPALKKDQRTVSVDYGNETVTITYRPSEWTPAVEEEWDTSEGSAISGPIATLEKLIVGWDIYEDEEQTKLLAINGDNIKHLPNALIMTIISGIAEDTAPGKAKSTGSSASGRRRN